MAGYKKETFGSIASGFLAGKNPDGVRAWRVKNGYSPTLGGSTAAADGNTRKVQPAHTAGPYRAQGASITGGSSVNGVPANSQPLKWNERL